MGARYTSQYTVIIDNIYGIICFIIGDYTESTSVFIGNSIKTSGFIQHCIDVVHNNSSVNVTATSNRHVLVSDSSSLSRPPPLRSIYKDQIERLKTDSSLYRMVKYYTSGLATVGIIV